MRTATPSARSRMATSRLGGVATILPEAVASAAQLSLDLQGDRPETDGDTRPVEEQVDHLVA